MTNEEKLSLLNAIEVIDSSASAGELESVYIELSQQNINILTILGATASEIYEVTDPGDNTIDIAGIGFKYTNAEWFEKRLGGFLKHRPLDADEAQMELIEASYPKEKTYKEILLSYGLDIEVIGRWTEEQCKAECDDINREVF